MCACGSSTTCELSAPSSGDGTLTQDAELLRDVNGRIVQLRGVDMGGRSKFAPYAPFDFADGGYDAALDAYLDRAQAWGVDVARVPFTWEAIEAVQGQDDEAFLARYDALIAGLWKRGIRSIIDFHQDIYSQNYCGDGFPQWTLPMPWPLEHHDCPGWGGGYLMDTEMMHSFDRFWASGSTVQAQYVSLWQRLATRYAHTPGVIGFEPINEPGWGTADLASWESQTLPPFFTSMIATLQAIAPDKLVFFEGAGSDGIFVQTHLERPQGAGLVFAPHYYQLSYDPSRVAQDLRYFVGRGRTWHVPVLLGEFGIDSKEPVAEDLMRAHWDALESLGLHGTQWEYSTASELWNSEHFSLTEADGTENVTVKPLVRAYLSALAGSGPTVTRSEGQVVWSWTGAKGVSEIVVPKRLTPKGYDVVVTGACADSTHEGVLLVKADREGEPVSVTVKMK